MSRPASAAAIRVGTDLVSAADVESSIATFGDKYVCRIYTAQEARTCAGVDGRPTPDRLAARFAAKEAVVKVLRPAGARPEWTSIEVVRDLAGGCDVHLSGLAAELARDAGITGLAVSLTHDGDNAAATVVALRGGAPELSQLREAAQRATDDALPASEPKGTS